MCDWQNDWKMITLFVGVRLLLFLVKKNAFSRSKGNDLCIFCEDFAKHTPANYVQYLNETLNYLFNNSPRTFVSLVLVLDIRGVAELNDGGTVCQMLHRRTCPCAAYPQGNDSQTLDLWLHEYQQKLVELINTGVYDRKDDFTVVIQPFFAHTKLPRTMDGQIDLTYFAPDCFHFSGNFQYFLL